MAAAVGRDYAVYFSLSESDSDIPTDFKRLGSLRSKSFGPVWEDVDATTDTSPDQIRQYLATFKSFDCSLSGLVDDDESSGHDELEDYIINPDSGQPVGWLKFERPTKNSQVKSYTLPVLFTGTPISANYDAVAEVSFDAKSRGPVTIAYV